MSARPPVPRNIERMLWAEAIGYCMNPDCQTTLVQKGTNVGEMAHVVPNKLDGGVSFENLILLCRMCHKMTDGNRTDITVHKLRMWKDDRRREIEKRFTARFTSFEELKNATLPILRRNGQIFEDYGPFGDTIGVDRHKLWLTFEKELISNNKKLEIILTSNSHLLHGHNEMIVHSFIAHAREFVETRNHRSIERLNLFPTDLLSIFGLAEHIDYKPVPDVSALQNLISDLIREDRFIGLQLEPEQMLAYRNGDRTLILDLKDTPNVKQIYWTGRYYRPKSTELELGNLVFFLQWLSKNEIEYSFGDFSDLTRLTLQGKHVVKLCYKYCLSLSDVYEIEMEDDLMVINLYTWNGGCVTDDAREYGSTVGISLFTQKEFFAFAHRNIK